MAIIVGSIFLYVVLRMFGNSGRPGINETTSFPYDSGTSIAPPSWSSDPGDAVSCDIENGTGSDAGGECDSNGGDD